VVLEGVVAEVVGDVAEAEKKPNTTRDIGLAFTRYCHHRYGMVHGMKGGAGGGRWGGIYCAMGVQCYCNSLGFTGGGGAIKG